MAPLSDSSWKCRDGSTPVFERPLCFRELGLYWDSNFEGTADTLQHAEVEVHAEKFRQAISPSNITRVWIDLKRQYPLLGAQLQERDEHSVFFVVSEDQLRKCQPAEVTFRTISSQQEAMDLTEQNIVGGRLLSNSLLASIHVLERTDVPNRFHLVFHVAHCITDGMANITILKTFLDRLCTSSPPAQAFKQRLALSVASEDLAPQRKFTAAKRRWRRATAQIIAIKRNSRKSGGHTLPCKVTPRTPYTPAYSRTVTSTLSPKDSENIFLNCRKNGLTFGNAIPILAQIALTRILLRRYLRGEMSEEEWDFRKREPMSSGGPLDLRPFLDRKWLEEGGLANVSLAISFCYFDLPFMPLGSAANIRPGQEMPSFGDLLPQQRFLLRCRSMQAQFANYISHPLFSEFVEIRLPARVQEAKDVGLQWRADHKAPEHLSAEVLSPIEQASFGLVHCNSRSSMGKIDLLLPQNYPLLGGKGNKDPEHLVHLKTSTTRLRCRPMELYLGALTRNNELHLWVFWDGNVYEDVLVHEWLEEVKQATDFYLGRHVNPPARPLL